MLPPVTGNPPAGTVQDPFVKLINGDACYEKVVVISTLLIRLSSQYLGTPPLLKLVAHLKTSDRFIKLVGVFATTGQVITPNEQGTYALLDNSKGYITAGKIGLLSIFLLKAMGAAYDEKFGAFSKPEMLRQKVFTHLPVFNLMIDALLSIFCATKVWTEVPACYKAFKRYGVDDTSYQKWHHKHLLAQWSIGEKKDLNKKDISEADVKNSTEYLKSYYSLKVETLTKEIDTARIAATHDQIKLNKFNAAKQKVALFEGLDLKPESDLKPFGDAFAVRKDVTDINKPLKYPSNPNHLGKIEQNIQFYAAKMNADQMEFRRAGLSAAAALAKIGQVFFSNYVKFMGLAEVASWMLRVDLVRLFSNVVGITKIINDAYSPKPTATV